MSLQFAQRLILTLLALLAIITSVRSSETFGTTPHTQIYNQPETVNNTASRSNYTGSLGKACTAYGKYGTCKPISACKSGTPVPGPYCPEAPANVQCCLPDVYMARDWRAGVYSFPPPLIINESTAERKSMAQHRAKFESFVLKFNKSYVSIKARNEAFRQFVVNRNRLIDVNDQNNNRVAVFSSQTKFADLSLEELKNRLSIPIGISRAPRSVNDSLDDWRPSVAEFDFALHHDDPFFKGHSFQPLTMDNTFGNLYVDYRNLLTRIADQGIDDNGVPLQKNPATNEICGSCWAHVAAECMESQLIRHTGQRVELSPQHLLQCSPGGSCSGGFFERVFRWYQSGIQACTRAEFPYTGSWDRDCPSQFSKSGGRGPTASSMVTIYNGGNSQDFQTRLLAALKQFGPLGMQISAYDLIGYSAGIVTSARNCTINHAVQLVGFGEATQGGQRMQFWLLRNSWGSDWGENGYFRVQAFNDSFFSCFFDSFASVPIMDQTSYCPPGLVRSSQSKNCECPWPSVLYNDAINATSTSPDPYVCVQWQEISLPTPLIFRPLNWSDATSGQFYPISVETSPSALFPSLHSYYYGACPTYPLLGFPPYRQELIDTLTWYQEGPDGTTNKVVLATSNLLSCAWSVHYDAKQSLLSVASRWTGGKSDGTDIGFYAVPLASFSPPPLTRMIFECAEPIAVTSKHRIVMMACADRRVKRQVWNPSYPLQEGIVVTIDSSSCTMPHSFAWFGDALLMSCTGSFNEIIVFDFVTSPLNNNVMAFRSLYRNSLQPPRSCSISHIKTANSIIFVSCWDGGVMAWASHYGIDDVFSYSTVFSASECPKAYALDVMNVTSMDHGVIRVVASCEDSTAPGKIMMALVRTPAWGTTDVLAREVTVVQLRPTSDTPVPCTGRVFDLSIVNLGDDPHQFAVHASCQAAKGVPGTVQFYPTSLPAVGSRCPPLRYQLGGGHSFKQCSLI